MVYRVIQGDCIEVMRGMPDCSVDAICTDPPYGLSDHKPAEVLACLTAWINGKPYTPKAKGGFMGKGWDAWVPGPEMWREALRVLKPGGHLLAFAGTRSMDLMCIAVRLAGFELRDGIGYAHDGGGAPLLAWTFGSGFPKSHDVSKAIDKAAGAKREVIGTIPDRWTGKGNTLNFSTDRQQSEVAVTGGAVTGGAVTWQGWGTALKPAWEPIILARKPLEGTVAANVLKHGAGALNIEACRVPTEDDLNDGAYSTERQESASPWAATGSLHKSVGQAFAHPAGRWPANLIHDGSDEVLAAFPSNAGAASPVRGTEASAASVGRVTGERGRVPGAFHADTGSAARFFYCSKASRRDRNEGMNEGGGPAVGAGATMRDKEDADWAARNGNPHPTVKPTALMRYLVRLITPPGGTVLDMHAGSGSTGKAAILEGFDVVLIELAPEFVAVAEARCAHAAREVLDLAEAERRAGHVEQPDLFGDSPAGNAPANAPALA
jgi:DNA methylase